MPIITPPIPQILNTDTFTEWKDKCNRIITGLDALSIPTTDNNVFIDGAQTITGLKTFSSITEFSGGIKISGVSNIFGGGETLINSSGLTVRATTAPSFIGANGINFRLNDGTGNLSLKYGTTADKLIFDYDETADGTFELADGNILSLAGSTPRIRVGTALWNLPATAPTVDSVLQWKGSSPNAAIEWTSFATLADSITPAVITQIGTSSLTLTSSLMPVGATIDVDETALSGWLSEPNGNGLAGTFEAANFPGWLVLNNQLITAEMNVEYLELIKLLTDDINATSVNLTHRDGGAGITATKKLIKYKKDPITTFRLEKGNGIEFVDSTNTPLNNIGLSGGKIQINTTADLNFDSTGKLGVFAVEAATPSTIVKRTSGGQIIAATPSANNHVATKAYVDIAAASNDSGSTIAFGEIVRDDCAYDGYHTFVYVDKFGAGKAFGYNHHYRGGYYASAAQHSITDLTLSTFSPISNSVPKFKRAFSTVGNYFFVDEDDIIYGSGHNYGGVLGWQNRGLPQTSANPVAPSSAEINYYKEMLGPLSLARLAYGGAIAAFLPAFLPYPLKWERNEAWPANAVTLDYVVYTGNTASEVANTNDLNVTIKTKDGIGRKYINAENPSLGLEKFINSLDNKPYTRGWYMSVGDNYDGMHGNGLWEWFGKSNTRWSSNNQGPVVWGVQGCGRALYINFGMQDSAARGRANIDDLGRIWTDVTGTTPVLAEQINKRFNHFKPNAVKEGGLGTTDDAALAEWRTQTGLTNTDTFDKYSWFIKKMVMHNETTYVIVGKPGTELGNELWSSGSGTGGAAGNGDLSSRNPDFQPVLESAGVSLGMNGIRVGNENVGTTQGVFQRVSFNPNGSTSPMDHGFEDFERLFIGTTGYIIVRGDDAVPTANLKSRFRLFPTTSLESSLYAVDAFARANRTSGASRNRSTFTAAQLSTMNFSHRKKFKGVYDIAISNYNDKRGAIAIKVDGENINALALDGLPISAITRNSLWGFGCALDGNIGIGGVRNVNNLYPVRAAFTVPPTTDLKFVKIWMHDYCGISFALTADGQLYACGYEGAGLLDSGTINNGNYITSWRRCDISSNYKVTNFFVSEGHVWNDVRPKIFVICEKSADPGKSYLFAGGLNINHTLGTIVYLNDETPNFVKIPFADNPADIVNINGYQQKTYILCKKDGKPGKVYEAGYGDFSDGFGGAANRAAMWPYFRNVDKLIA